MWSSQNLLISSCTALALSICLTRRSAPTLWSSFWPSTGPPPIGPFSFYAGGPRAEFSIENRVSWNQRGRIISLPCFFWFGPGYYWLSGLQENVADSHWAFHPPVSPSPSPEACSQSTHTSACVCAWDCPNPDAGPCTWSCWTSWSSHGPNFPACLGPPVWHSFPPVCQLHHPSWCCPWTHWGYTQSHCHWSIGRNFYHLGREEPAGADLAYLLLALLSSFSKATAPVSFLSTAAISVLLPALLRASNSYSWDSSGYHWRVPGIPVWDRIHFWEDTPTPVSYIYFGNYWGNKSGWPHISI